MSIHWPKKALDALTYLFRPLQDLDVYVEDKGSEAFYTELLARIAPDGVKIKRVFSLGGNLAVQDKAKSHDFEQRRALFLIDGDLPWVRGDDPPQVEGLYRLEAYCIENMLICPHAIAQVLMENEACGQADAEAKLGFEAWVQQVECLVVLFAHWAALHRIDPTIRTVSQDLRAVLTTTNKRASVDATKVEALRERAEAAILAVPDGKKLLQEVQGRVNALEFPLDCVSGKDFLMPVIQLHLQGLSQERMRRPALNFRLARHIAHDRAAGLSDALERAARGRAATG